MRSHRTMSGGSKGSASPSPTHHLNRTPSPSSASSSLGNNRYDGATTTATQMNSNSPVVRKLSSVKVSTPPNLAPVLDDAREQNVESGTRSRTSRPKPVFMLGADDGGEEETTNARTQKTMAAAAKTTALGTTRRPRRTTISNAAEPMSELNLNYYKGGGGGGITAKSVPYKSPYSNLYNFNIAGYQQQLKRHGSAGLSDIVSTQQQQMNLLLQQQQQQQLDTDNIIRGGGIHKSKSSPALISQAVRELPVQTHVSASQNSLASLLKQLAQDNIKNDILSSLPSPCFKLVNSPPSPSLCVGSGGERGATSSPKFFPAGQSTPSPKLLSGEHTPPPSFFQAASPASWKNYVDLQRRVRSPSESESGAGLIHRASSLGNKDKENALKARNRLKSKSDIAISMQQQQQQQQQLLQRAEVNEKRNSMNLTNRMTSPSPTARSQLFANRDENFYSSPTEISMELNKDLALDPIPPPLSTDSIDGIDILQTSGGGLFHTLGMLGNSEASTTVQSINEIEFLFTLSETLLKLTTDSHISGQVSDCIPEIKRKRPDVIPSAEALKLAKLLLTSEAMRISSYALKFVQSQQKKGVIKPTDVLKKSKEKLPLFFHFFTF